MKKHNKQFNLAWSIPLSYAYIRHLAQVNRDDDGASNVFISTPIKNHKHWYLPSHFSLAKKTKNPYISNRATNLYKASHIQWHKANQAVRDICKTIYNPNLHHDMIMANVTSFRVVQGLLEPPKSLPRMKSIRCHDKHTRLMEAPILTSDGIKYPAYRWFYSHQSNINHAIKLSHGLRLLSSIESVQYYTRLYIHNQFMALVPSNTNLKSFTSHLSHQLGCKVSCHWLCLANEDHSNDTPVSFSPKLSVFWNLTQIISKASNALKKHQLQLGDRRIEAIIAMVHYLYKQKKLPVCYGNNTRACNDYLRFQHLSFKDKSVVMDGVSNSTYYHSNQIHISYKRLVNETNRHLIKQLAFLLALASIKSNNGNISYSMNRLHWQQHLASIDLIIKHHYLLSKQRVIKHRLSLIDHKLDLFNFNVDKDSISNNKDSINGNASTDDTDRVDGSFVYVDHHLDSTNLTASKIAIGLNRDTNGAHSTLSNLAENRNLSHFSLVISNYQAINKKWLMKQLSWARNDYRTETTTINKEISIIDSVSDTYLNSLLSNDCDNSFNGNGFDVQKLLIGDDSDYFNIFADSGDFLSLRRSSGIPP